MKVFRIYPENINEKLMAQAVDSLKDGNVIIYPTDSVYGFAVDALNKKAIEKLCSIKGIDPDKNLLSLVCADISQASDYVRIDNKAFGVLKRCLPGPFTFILPASIRLPKTFKNRKTIGLRIPDNPIATRLSALLGNPLLSCSVDINPDNPEEYIHADELALKYSNQASVVIDGGKSDTQLTTVVDLCELDEPEIIRQGKGEF